MDYGIPAKFTPQEAVEIQKKLRGEIQIVPLVKQVKDLKYIGGCDVSMNMFSAVGFAGFVTLSFSGLTLVDHSVVKDTIRFPYVPGLLSFREIPMLLKAWQKLKMKPEVIVVDGVGIAHPRRMGIATHLGLILGVPTVGCSKSVLVGHYDEPGEEPGSVAYMYDPKDPSEIIGAAVRTKRGVKPVFVSPGHRITLEESIEIILHSIKKHRLPEETRLAHNTVNEYRKKDLGKNPKLI